MDVKKILLVALIAVAIVASVSAVSAGLFDGLLSGEPEDTVVELDNIQFNTTNVSDFKLYNKSTGWKMYMTENTSGYTVHIQDFDKYEGTLENAISQNTEDNKNAPVQSVNGIVVYTKSANIGKHDGEPRYIAYVENRDLNMLITLWSPDPNETAKMASTLKFK